MTDKPPIIPEFDFDVEYYHGTNTSFPKFKEGITFVADSPETAGYYAGDLISDVGNPNIIPVSLRKDLNVFDVDNPEHIKLLRKSDYYKSNKERLDGYAYGGGYTGDEENFIDSVEAGNYDAIEESGLIDWIKKNNFEGFTTYEQEGKNIAVFDPENIRPRFDRFDEPRPYPAPGGITTTDQSNLPDVISDPPKDPNKFPKSKGSLFRGIGKLAQSRIFPLIQMAQGAYGALSEEQKSEISNFLDKPAYELVGMEKPGLEYFKDLLLGEKPSTEVSETPAENLMKFSPRTTELSKEALDAFKNVSDTQRGRPELAMNQLQMEGAAYELHGVVEHIGDLTHVLTNEAPYGSFRRDRVLSKIAGQINTLDKPASVINNFLEQNYRREAEFSKRDINEIREVSERLLKQYAEEHKKVPVYNRPQFFAREAAVAVGEKRYSDAVDYLKKLRSIAEDPVEFQQAASTFIKPEVAKVSPDD